MNEDRSIKKLCKGPTNRDFPEESVFLFFNTNHIQNEYSLILISGTGEANDARFLSLGAD